MTDLTTRVLADVADERMRQDAKWGKQNHPDADEALLARLARDDIGAYSVPTMVAARLISEYEIPSAAIARARCQAKAANGVCTWTDIALEEFAETVEAVVYAIAKRDPGLLRTEVIQCAAVFTQWAEAIDRRPVVEPSAVTP